MSIFGKIGRALKGVAKIATAPARGVGHALATSGIPLVSNVGSAAEHVGKAFGGEGGFLTELGQAGQSAAPIAGLIPGVGIPLGAALGAGGTLLAQGKKAKFGDVLKRAGEGAASAYAGKKFLGGRGFQGIPNAVSGATKGGLKGMIGRAIGGGGAPGAAAGEPGVGVMGAGGGLQGTALARAAPAAARAAGGGGIRGALGKVGGWIGKHPLDAAQIGLAGLNAVQANQLKKKQFGLMGSALDRVNSAADASPPDLSDTFADPGNPYNPPRRLPPAQGAKALLTRGGRP